MPILRKDERGVLFIHVPKTGGSSIEHHFVEAGWDMAYHSGRVGKGTVNHYRWCTPQHQHAELLRSNFRLDRFDAIFMVVRDPVARFRSEYAWRNGIDTGRVDPSASAVEKWAERAFATYESYPFMLGNHIRPQADYLVEGADVFRFEDGLDAAVARLNDLHGLELPGHVGRVKTSEDAAGVSSRDIEISPALEGRLREFYARDYELFGYADGAPAPAAAVDGQGSPRLRREVAREQVARRTSDVTSADLLQEVVRRGAARARAVFTR